MFSPRRLLELLRKRKKVAALRRKRLFSNIAHGDNPGRSNASLARKGHFVVYTMDGWRFELPLSYLNSNVLRELFRASEELFGLSGNQPITLPCDAIFMGCTIAFRQNHLSKNVEDALVKYITHVKCSVSLLASQGHRNQHEILHGF